MEYRVKEIQREMEEAGVAAAAEMRNPAVLGVCLSSRRNLCIHPQISRYDNPNKVDAMCRNLTANHVREGQQQERVGAMEESADVELCDFYEGYHLSGTDANLSGIYGLEDMKVLGRERNWCPYFMARHMINLANVIVYNYQYMLDPKISGMVSKELEKDSIIVFDEAHNIDNICIEALSVTLDRRTIQASKRNLSKLKSEVTRLQRTDAARLNEEYQNLVAGLGVGVQDGITSYRSS